MKVVMIDIISLTLHVSWRNFVDCNLKKSYISFSVTRIWRFPMLKDLLWFLGVVAVLFDVVFIDSSSGFVVAVAVVVAIVVNFVCWFHSTCYWYWYCCCLGIICWFCSSSCWDGCFCSWCSSEIVESFFAADKESSFPNISFFRASSYRLLLSQGFLAVK